MESPRFVVVGGGPAAAAAARRIAEAGEAVALLTAEPEPPYDRTVLTKAVLLDPSAKVPSLWPADAPWRENVFVRTRTPVASLDPDRGVLTTEDGTTWAFERVVLAPGAEPVRLASTGVRGADGPGVHHVRDAGDATALTAALTSGRRLVVVGGGVIGLEVAAAAVQRGLDVEVVEAGRQVLGRGVPEPVAAWLAARHREHGVRVRTGVRPVEVVREDDGAVRAVRLSDGASLPADLVVVGIGVRPRTDLAEAAGITVDDGIVVDASMRTSHPAVLAAGDAVRMRPADADAGERGVRLESYTAAGTQGTVAGDGALGREAAFTEVPWTWSDQYDTTLQVTGLPPAGADEVVLEAADGTVVLSVVDGRLVGVSGAGRGPAVARPVRQAAAAVAAGVHLDLAVVRATSGDLTALARLLRDAGRG